MKKSHFVVFDTETGGLDASENPILEIALVALDGSSLAEIERDEFFIIPYDELTITKDALKANGLNVAKITESGITKQEAFKRIVALTKRLNPKGHPMSRPIMVGHNVKFDVDFMEMFFYLNNEKDLYDYFHRTTCCTMLDMKRVMGTERLDLTSCCNYFGIELSNAHRAMPDTLATAELFRQLTLRFRNNKKVEETTNKEKVKRRDKFQF